MLEVDLGELEAVGRAHHRAEPLFAIGGGRLAQQETTRRGGAAADAAAQLMQLREPETVGVDDDHHRCVRHVDADFDHRGRDQHVDLAGAERSP